MRDLAAYLQRTGGTRPRSSATGREESRAVLRMLLPGAQAASENLFVLHTTAAGVGPAVSTLVKSTPYLIALLLGNRARAGCFRSLAAAGRRPGPALLFVFPLVIRWSTGRKQHGQCEYRQYFGGSLYAHGYLLSGTYRHPAPAGLWVTGTGHTRPDMYSL